jgi:HEAT repeat protein
MLELRLRRRFRILLILFVMTAALAAYGWMRPAARHERSPGDEVDSARDERAARSSTATTFGDRIQQLHEWGRIGGAQATSAVIHAYRKATTTRTKLTAIEQMGRIASAQAIDELRYIAAAETHEIAAAAIGALGRCRTSAAVTHLLELLEHGTETDAVIAALGQAGGSDATAALVAIARDSRSPSQRQAIAALGTAANAEAVRMLASLTSAGTTSVRTAAIEALSQAGTAAALQTLLSLTKRPNGGEIRAAAAYALRNYTGEAVDGVLAQLVKDNDPEVSRRALTALAGRNNPETDRLLIAQLNNGADSWNAAWALAKSKNPDSRGALIDAALLAGPNQSALINAMTSIRGPDVDKALEQVVQTGNGYAAAQSLRELARRRGSAAGPLLLEAYRSGTPSVRTAALHALAETRHPQARELILSAAKSGLPGLAPTAVQSLVALGGADLANTLMGLAKEGSPSVRVSALAALANTGDEQARPLIVDAVRKGEMGGYYLRQADPETKRQLAALLDDPSVGSAAKTQTLSALSYAGDMDAIRRAAQHSDPTVAAFAMQQLGHRGGKDALETLMNGFNSSQPSVRQAALSGIASLGGSRAVEVLSNALSDDKLAGVALSHLMQIGDRRSMEHVEQHFSSGTVAQRRDVIRNIYGYNLGPQGLRLLSQALADGDSHVAEEAARKLGQVGTAEVQQQLRATLERTTNPRLRAAIDAILKQRQG